MGALADVRETHLIQNASALQSLFRLRIKMTPGISFFWGIVQSAASPLSLRTIMGVIIAINICIMVVETDVAGHNIFQHWHDTCAFLVN